MRIWEYELQDVEGLHARPACMMASVVYHHESKVCVRCQSKIADGSDVLELIGLDARCGDRIAVEVSGEDEEETLEALKQVFR